LSIKRLIIILVVLMTAAPLGLILYAAVRQRDHESHRALTLAASVANKVFTEQNILVSGAEQLAMTLSHVPAIRNRDAFATNRILADLVSSSPQYTLIFMVDNNGVCWASPLPEQISKNYSERRYFYNALRTGRFSSGEFTIGKVLRSPILSFGYPVRDDAGNITGIVAIVIDLQRYQQLFEKDGLLSDTSVELMDHKGTILYSSIDQKRLGTQDRPELFDRMNSGNEEGAFEALGHQNIKRLFSYRKMKLKGEQRAYMYVRAGLNRDQLLSGIRRDFVINVSVLSGIMFMVIGLAIFISKRSIHDKIIILSNASRKIAQGDLSVRVANSVSGGELGELGLAFDEMADRLANNISERETAELELKKLEVQLSQAHKLESIGRLAGGVAHDFNNMLTPILGYAEILMTRIEPGSRNYEMLSNIRKSADKARILTQQLLSFGRKQVLEIKTIDMNEVINSFHEILRRTIRESIDIRLNLTGDLIGIRADRNQLEQILMNLAINAQDAIAYGGAITIETVPVVLDNEFVRQHVVVKAGKYLMMAVSDNGSGMDRDTSARIFEPFYTTKSMGKGTGLGLATVYGLVKQHNGYIWVYSEVGIGTTFKLYFPVVDELPSSDQDELPEEPGLTTAGLTILLVEDDEMVRGMVCNLLQRLGFDVIAPESPKHALKACEGRAVDLLISDVVMPEMTGPELYKKLQRYQAYLKVIYMSGYTDDVIIHHGVLDEGVNFIQKPFAVNKLVKKIESVLGGTPQLP
jgi:C4-dicarboxylate-specific signal transduction histidine kinase